MKELCSDSRAEIVRLYTQEHIPQHEIANKFKVTSQLVARLVKQADNDPEKQLRLVQKE